MMKQKVGMMLLLLLTVVPLRAQTEAQKPKVGSLVLAMERLGRADQWLAAMDTATLVLTLDPQSRAATNFVYRNWDKMTRQMETQLRTLTDEYDLEQAEQRCELYRLLDNIYAHLLEIDLPLYGPNDSWVWQPEVGYYAGHYEAERRHTLQLLFERADQALASHDAEQAQQYYLLALSKYLLADTERQSNLETMLTQCNTRLNRCANSSHLSDALFAWDLSQLSLALDSSQTQVKALRPTLQAHIADLYNAQAEAMAQKGDSVQAHEYRLSALDWQPVATPLPDE